MFVLCRIVQPAFDFCYESVMRRSKEGCRPQAVSAPKWRQLASARNFAALRNEISPRPLENQIPLRLRPLLPTDNMTVVNKTVRGTDDSAHPDGSRFLP